jgi:hypothetical protein
MQAHPIGEWQMDFHTPIDTFVAMKGLVGDVVRKLDPITFYNTAIGIALRGKDGASINQLQSEYHWYANKRPYYRIWPDVMQALLKVNLDKVLTTSLVLPHGLNTLALYLPKGHEIPYGTEGRAARTILIAKITMAKSLENLSFEERLEFYMKRRDEMIHGFMILIDSGSEYADYEYIKFRILEDVTVGKEVETMSSFPSNILRLACAIMLLDDDPELINPDVLADDRARYDHGDPALRQRLEEKARRRGKIGWDIGKSLREMGTHYRHPHFAIRWCGKGRKESKLTRIKGTFVNREKALALPTGYEDQKHDIR